MTKKQILEITNETLIVVKDIVWSVDDDSIEDVSELGLPYEIELDLNDFSDDFNFHYDLADWLSDEYGYCVVNYDFYYAHYEVEAD